MVIWTGGGQCVVGNASPSSSHGRGCSHDAVDEGATFGVVATSCASGETSGALPDSMLEGPSSMKENEPCPTSAVETLQQHYEQVAERMQFWLGQEELMLQRLLAEHRACLAKRNFAGEGSGTSHRGATRTDLPSDDSDSSGAQSRQHPAGASVTSGTSRQARLSMASAEEASDDGERKRIRFTYNAIAEACRITDEIETVLPSTWPYRDACKAFVEDWKFETFFACLVFFNSVLIGLELHFRQYPASAETELAVSIAQHMCFLAFMFEIVFRLWAYGTRLFTGPSAPWNVFDVFLVTFSAVEVVGEVLRILSPGVFDMETSQNVAAARILRIIRITRLMRVLRIARLVRFVRALRVLIFSIGETMKSVTWAMVLLLIIIYFFAVLFSQSTVEYLQDNPNDPEIRAFWGSLLGTMLTLLQSVTGGVDWGNAVDPLGRVHFLLVSLFIFYIMFSLFAVLNVITGVFCQGAIEGKQIDTDLMVQQVLTTKRADLIRVTDTFKNLLRNMGSDHVTQEKLAKHIMDDSFQALLAMLGLNTSDACVLFRLLDGDDSSIDPETFLEGCMRLKGSARSIDLASMEHDMKLNYKAITSMIAELKDDIERSLVLNSQLTSQSNVQLAPLRRQFPFTAPVKQPQQTLWPSVCGEGNSQHVPKRREASPIMSIDSLFTQVCPGPHGPAFSKLNGSSGLMSPPTPDAESGTGEDKENSRCSI